MTKTDMIEPKLLILNGPNLNMLGRRDPAIYGHETLEDIKALCEKAAAAEGFTADFRQSNHEGTLVDWIQEAADTEGIAGVIINAGAYTHTSVAIHDALEILHVPVIEVHLSNPKKRESFRHVSYVEPVAKAVFAGRGAKSYVLAIEDVARMLSF